MAAPRLSDAQKQELVSRFQDGSSTQELADAYGCSPNTVIRVVKAALSPAVYEELKRSRGRRAAAVSETPDAAPQAAAAMDPAAMEPDPVPMAAAHESGAVGLSDCEPDGSAAAAADPVAVAASKADAPAPAPRAVLTRRRRSSAGAPAQAADAATDAAVSTADDARSAADDSPADSSREAARVLAIDDADDFGDDDEEDDAVDEPGADGLEGDFVEVPVSYVADLDQAPITARPWRSDELPDSAYMLVDKTVELQTRPLGEISELGRVAPEELELQALVLYINPRQAKRQCGRTQRVIKVPDVGVFERTAPYLLRQGIRRVVLEGALYALPEA